MAKRKYRWARWLLRWLASNVAWQLLVGLVPLAFVGATVKAFVASENAWAIVGLVLSVTSLVLSVYVVGAVRTIVAEGQAEHRKHVEAPTEAKQPNASIHSAASRRIPITPSDRIKAQMRADLQHLLRKGEVIKRRLIEPMGLQIPREIPADEGDVRRWEEEVCAVLVNEPRLEARFMQALPEEMNPAQMFKAMTSPQKTLIEYRMAQLDLIIKVDLFQ
jgi:hypothetical protein